MLVMPWTLGSPLPTTKPKHVYDAEQPEHRAVLRALCLQESTFPNFDLLDVQKSACCLNSEEDRVRFAHNLWKFDAYRKICIRQKIELHVVRR